MERAAVDLLNFSINLHVHFTGHFQLKRVETLHPITKKSQRHSVVQDWKNIWLLYFKGHCLSLLGLNFKGSKTSHLPCQLTVDILHTVHSRTSTVKLEGNLGISVLHKMKSSTQIWKLVKA